jgi:glucosylceramidase
MKLFLLLTFVTFVSKCSSPIDATTNNSKSEVSITPFPATEGNDSIYKIEIKKASDVPTTINLVTSKGIVGTPDYKSIETTKTIDAGQTSVIVSFPKNNSIINQNSDTYNLTATLNSANNINSETIFSKAIVPNTRNRVCDMDIWKTKSDQSVLLQIQPPNQFFTRVINSYQNINVDDTQTYQSVDGFGYTLTGGSAQVINTLTASKKQELLLDLFGNNSNSIGISYLRISIGASDLNATVFSYDDMPNGQVDMALDNFSLANDNELILLLKEIL